MATYGIGQKRKTRMYMANLHLAKEIFNLIYPVGSIYISVNQTNPSTLFGGTWSQVAQGRTLIGVNTNDGDFNTAKKIGGSKNHNHLYGLQYGAYYANIALETNPNVGLLDYSDGSNFVLSGSGAGLGNLSGGIVNSNSSASNMSPSMMHYRMTAHTSKTVNLPPYYTCYIWCRTA